MEANTTPPAASKAKRRRIVTTSDGEVEAEALLPTLLFTGKWAEAIARVSSHPEETRTNKNPSPLALACRHGAPYDCVRAILEACPEKLRHVLDARGTPLHEAIVGGDVGASVIEVLLRADERLEALRKNGQGSHIFATRATLLQDVDGFTPLHLLIRRRFQAHILNDESANLMQILEMLTSSCPEAVLIPDRGEYEEPPIIYALKANIYAPALLSDDDTIARVERQCRQMVACMLKYCPEAAAQVFTGYRGQYTALHSAVFHGRDASTIELLLRTEAQARSDGQTNCVLANTQGELPLHFCAMRGERPSSVALVANAAPQAVVRRDISGLTPLNWLWARFVSSLLALDRLGAGNDATVEPLRIVRDPAVCRYSAFASLEQGDFELDLQLIKRMDPPVDFLRMRHIPIDVLGPADSVQWAEQAVQVLQALRERFNSEKASGAHTWSRRECVIALFWTKVVSLIQASASAIDNAPRGDSILVHSAFASTACLPAIARIVANLFPEELIRPDDFGRLPIHYAASRPFHEWDWPREHGDRSASAQLLKYEAVYLIETALSLSPEHALEVQDHEGCLPLHVFIDNICSASSQFPLTNESICNILTLLDRFVEKNQVSLQRADGRSRLYPFLQAAATFSEHPASRSSSQVSFDRLSVSVTYQLLRENPATMIPLTK